jgi:hypothetical protein
MSIRCGECAVQELRKELTAKTRKGITSAIIRVDFTPNILKKPTDPRTDNATIATPAKPKDTCSHYHYVMFHTVISFKRLNS